MSWLCYVVVLYCTSAVLERPPYNGVKYKSALTKSSKRTLKLNQHLSKRVTEKSRGTSQRPFRQLLYLHPLFNTNIIADAQPSRTQLRVYSKLKVSAITAAITYLCA